MYLTNQRELSVLGKRLPQLLTEWQSLLTKTFSAPKPRNKTLALENKMKNTIEKENSNFDAAHWQAKPAEYEHFHGY